MNSKYNPQVGELVLYHNRLVEVTRQSTPLRSGEVQLVDEGGITWHYDVTNGYFLRPLTDEGETSLDAVRRATAPPVGPEKTIGRFAERWFGAPEIGDMFFVSMLTTKEPQLMWFQIHDITSSGEIICANYHQHIGGEEKLWTTSGQIYRNADALRKRFVSRTRPGYRALAHATRRPEYQGHQYLSSEEWVTSRGPLFTMDMVAR